MCGITGFVGKGGLQDLLKMTAHLEHRGPDEEGIWHDRKEGVYLGHRRLSVIDIHGGSQPMWTSDGSIGVIYNGEIYNHEKLRRELKKKGHVFNTDHSDTEVLLHGYREWQTGLPDRLNGMWAFAVYDKVRKIIFLSRDRFGKKPLFYTLQNRTFAFASELSALILHPFIDLSISKRSLKKYFAYGYIPTPKTPYSNIEKLPGGYNLIFSLKQFSLKKTKYWDFILEPFEKIPENPQNEWGEQIRELLKKGVQRRLMSDVPLGVFLSGGIDSSSVAYFASENVQSEKLKTFSIGFVEESFDESNYAGAAAKCFGNTIHHNEALSIEKAINLLPNITSKLDEPMGDSSLIPMYLLCQETKKHVTVALGGDGGDELFAGYDPFKALRIAEIYSKIVPKPLHRGILMALSLMPVSHRYMSLDFKLKRSLEGLSYPSILWNPVWMGTLKPNELEELFSEPFDIEDVYSEAIECWETCSQDNLVDKTLQFYTKIYLQNSILVKADRASMMNSLEVRSPFLDIDLVDFVRKIPFSWKYRNGQTKYIFKKAMEPVLPRWIIYRVKKGFGAPIGRWFQNGSLAVDLSKSAQGLNAAAIKQRMNEHQKKKADHRHFLWSFWILEKFNMS
jgi:asparagine synthase (glutamine-hydrolysing)